MQARFFEQPVLNSPYDYPSRHWELDRAKIVITNFHAFEPVDRMAPFVRFGLLTSREAVAYIVSTSPLGASAPRRKAAPLCAAFAFSGTPGLKGVLSR